MKIKERLKKSGGFTLIEMLIVVAIIAILVAVSIPMVSSNLNEAKIATDKANERAAKAAAMITYMTSTTTISDDQKFYYDAESGKLEGSESGINGYGQCSEHKGSYIIMTFDSATNSFETSWSGTGTGTVTEAHEIND